MTIDIRRLDLQSSEPEIIAMSTRRSALPDPAIRDKAFTIVAQVAAQGDEALRMFSTRFGGGLQDGDVAVSQEEIAEADKHISSEVAIALDTAITNVRKRHETQLPAVADTVQEGDILVERVWSPLRRVGVYVPGGGAIYPSSLIMGVVPAMVAGVTEICVATPARPDGTIDPVVLATAAKLGITEMYGMGGAQAIAALAYGTESVERVDKIVGPGGPWVTAAKLAVYGECGVDLPAGPSEAAIITDGTVDPAVTAADVMCQAEHGEESSVVLVATSERAADAVLFEIERQLPLLERADIITKALENHGRIVIAHSTRDALAYANAWAPEHLSIHTAEARADAAAVPNAGSVFIGEWTPESAGDYATGANHILPTGGLARSYGPLSVEDFGSWCQIQTLTREGLSTLASTITTLARAEGLTAHANSVTVRLGATS